MKRKIVVRQQKEIGSKQWGVYVNGKLVEGGFFYKAYAEKAARELSQYVCP